MPISERYTRIMLADIIVQRDERQRKAPASAGLKESIAKHGVLSPIIITQGMVLVAGERRLVASQELGIPDIPVRFFDELSAIEVQMVELEENLRREDLPWQDEVKAITRLHAMHCALAAREGKDWSQQKTADAIGVTIGQVSKILRVHKDLSDPRILALPSISTAYNTLERRDSRATDSTLDNLLSKAAATFSPDPPPPSAYADPAGLTPKVAAAPQVHNTAEAVLQLDFLEWAPKYEGQPFNFLHCDFPYGINVFDGAQAGKARHTAYDDDPAVYWKLIKGLGTNLNKIMTPSAHIMFWFSMEHYSQTLAAFRIAMPSLEFQVFPLIWTKSDNSGILPDPKRGPRRVYETCLIGSREDRLIVKAVGNSYPAPSDRTYHPSAKPEPVLRHFMQMFVDQHTTMLDPTCGGGSSLRAAESLGAKRVLGLELNEEHCESARHALRQFRALRGAKKDD